MTTIVTLTTDFGTRDSYVAQLKGVLLCKGPTALQLVDLSHELDAHDVRAAAFFLRFALPRFPRGTVHLVVVDPGVGSARRPIAAEVGGQCLVGPDNGVFGWLLSPGARVHQLAPVEAAPAPSATFHGRDVFAPAAARLARGEALQALGPRITDPLCLAWPEPSVDGGGCRGEVVQVDRFGNLITNLPAAALPQARLQVELEGRAIGPLRTHYAEVAQGALLALIGSYGLLEIAARERSAAQLSGAAVGSAVSVRAQVAEKPT